MIYEIVQLPVRSEHADGFEQAFAEVAPLLTRAEGYRGHVLARGVEDPLAFNLIVRWRSLEDHTPGFESSQDHERFMAGLDSHLSDEPSVHHVEGPEFAPIA